MMNTSNTPDYSFHSTKFSISNNWPQLLQKKINEIKFLIKIMKTLTVAEIQQHSPVKSII